METKNILIGRTLQTACGLDAALHRHAYVPLIFKVILSICTFFVISPLSIPNTSLFSFICRYVNDGRPFWQDIVSYSTECSDSQYFEERNSFIKKETLGSI